MKKVYHKKEKKAFVSIFAKNEAEYNTVKKVEGTRDNSRFMAEFNSAILEANFLDCQIKSGNYNMNTTVI